MRTPPPPLPTRPNVSIIGKSPRTRRSQRRRYYFAYERQMLPLFLPSLSRNFSRPHPRRFARPSPSALALYFRSHPLSSVPSAAPRRGARNRPFHSQRFSRAERMGVRGKVTRRSFEDRRHCLPCNRRLRERTFPANEIRGRERTMFSDF